MVKTTLVLGAGASMAYGYPSGGQLVESIIELLKKTNDSSGLKERLYVVRPDSIDQFISENKSMRGTLLGCVAETIARCERSESIYDVKKEDDFYRALLNSIPLSEYKNIQIITFNYDRSLEFALYKYLQFRFENKMPDFKSKLDELKIHHVYGRMLKFPWEVVGQNSGSEYGAIRERCEKIDLKKKDDEGRWAEARAAILSDLWHEASNFQTVYDEHKVDEVAKGMLEESSRILFLGFSYHPLNLLKLGYDFTKYCPTKVIAGTVKELPQTKLRQLERKFPAIHYLNDKPIVEFLKHDFDLSDHMNDVIQPEGIISKFPVAEQAEEAFTPETVES